MTQSLTKFSLVVLSLLFSLHTINAQKWSKVDNLAYRTEMGDRQIIPKSYTTYEMNMDDFFKKINSLQSRTSESTLIELPNAKGEIQKFRLYRKDVFHPELAKKFPEIRSYTARGIDDPSAIAKISVSHQGMDAMILSATADGFYIDKFAQNTRNTYIAYSKSDFHKHLDLGEGLCSVVDVDEKKHNHSHHSYARFGDCQLRKYRLALACTGEYAQFHGGTTESVMAAFNTAMNRVNGIYEKDAGITMELIPNNDTLIFFNAATDPYTNNQGGTMLGENQTTIDNYIGSDGYDIGHVFSTGGGGIASLRSPCTNRKARGVTGLGSPIGDPFWVDYVAHEMGHQFGGNHTQNNDCNRNGGTAVEPGSASTIMGYAGICNPNVQNNSDEHFHAINLREIADFVVAGAGGCSETMPLDNTPPEILSVSNPSNILPSQTPFALTADVMDIDDDLLTYCWEQMDNQVASMPPESNNTGGPSFRSFDPKTTPTRYFPDMNWILFGTNNATWEVLTSVTRSMTFNLTVRDNVLGGGCTADEEVTLQFTDQAGPFLITTQNTGTINWSAGEEVLIEWNVANTDVAPVNSPEVDIFLSIDGGSNFDIPIILNTPNDGNEVIRVPYQLSNDCRIMVKSSNSIFFDVNNRNIRISAPFSVAIDNPNQTICEGESVVYTISYSSILAEEEPVSFDIDGLPTGAQFEFTPNSTSGDTDVTLNITNTLGVEAGTYEMLINATGQITNAQLPISLTISPSTPPEVRQEFPENGSILNTLSTDIAWEESTGINLYMIEVATSPSFDNIVFSAESAQTATLFIGDPMTVYYWRVKSLSSCFENNLSLPFRSFQTGGLVCANYDGLLGDAIPPNETASIDFLLPIDEEGTAQQLKITMDISHTYVGDLIATLTTPSGMTSTIFSQPGIDNSDFGCNGDDLQVTFYDNASQSYEIFTNICSETSPAISGDFQPIAPMSVFNGEDKLGNWTLTLEDVFDDDGGMLNSWSMEVCDSEAVEPGIILINEPLVVEDGVEKSLDNSILNMDNTDPTNTVFTILQNVSFGSLELLVDGSFELLQVGDVFTQEDIDGQNIRYTISDNTATTDFFLFDAVDNRSRYSPNNQFDIIISLENIIVTTDITKEILCFDELTGEITASAIGGSNSYQFSLNDGPFEDDGIFTMLGAGDYTVTVRDDEGNESTSTLITITQPDPLSINAMIQSNTVVLSHDGGSGDVLYTIDGETFDVNDQYILENGQTYTFGVRDENGCETLSDVYTHFFIGSAVTEIENVSCFEGENGVIRIVEVIGGQGPFTYALNGGDFTDNNVFSDLPAGMYTVEIRDALQNELTVSDIIIIEPDFPLTLNFEANANLLVLEGIGGTPPYEYALDNDQFSPMDTFYNVSNGVHVGYVRDANGCIFVLENTIIITSIDEEFHDAFEIFPNPVSNFITIESGEYDAIQYSIITTDGKALQEGQILTSSSLDVSQIASGVYVLRLTKNDRFANFKVVIVK